MGRHVDCTVSRGRVGDALNERIIVERIRPGRVVTGMSAVLLPHTADGEIDWAATEAHVARTLDAGLTPAVNMDTGYVQLLTPDRRERVLDLAAAVTGGRFVAGAFVADSPGDPFDPDRHLAACERISARGGTPVMFPSHGLNELDDAGWVAALGSIGAEVDRLIGFELGAMFASTS